MVRLLVKLSVNKKGGVMAKAKKAVSPAEEGLTMILKGDKEGVKKLPRKIERILLDVAGAVHPDRVEGSNRSEATKRRCLEELIRESCRRGAHREEYWYQPLKAMRRAVCTQRDLLRNGATSNPPQSVHAVSLTE